MSDDKPRSSYASPPCMAGEVAPDYFDPLAVDPQQAVDVARWRKAKRAELLAMRAALPVTELQAAARGIAGGLDRVLEELLPDVRGKVISGFWPIKSEPDLRFWLAALAGRGAITALPVVETRFAPLVFRPWKPGDPMVRGDWNIPVPTTTETVQPDLALAPLVGWDRQGYRLGYGGGYFDRTLAAMKPLAVGIGLSAARIDSIFPQPHDIPLDRIVTEDGVQRIVPPDRG